jgi:hypothetical protein
LPTYDPDLKTFVRGERHREKLMQEKGIADVRDWTDPANIKKEAARNLQERREKINEGTREAVRKALQDAEAGVDFTPELEARLEEDAKQKAAEEDRRVTLMRENQEEDRRRWERDHQR